MDPERIMDFFEKFETERRSVSVILNELQTRLVELSIDNGVLPEEIERSIISSDMLTYYLAFAREGASEENVATRSRILYNRLIQFLKE